jgi:hypothetical protein
MVNCRSDDLKNKKKSFFTSYLKNTGEVDESTKYTPEEKLKINKRVPPPPTDTKKASPAQSDQPEYAESHQMEITSAYLLLLGESHSAFIVL